MCGIDNKTALFSIYYLLAIKFVVELNSKRLSERRVGAFCYKK